MQNAEAYITRSQQDGKTGGRSGEQTPSPRRGPRRSNSPDGHGLSNAPGLSPVRRPVGNFLFLGPTGSGKTRVVEATAESLLNDSRSVIKIDCAEFQHSHEIAKLIGSPPGYLG